jgi:RNA methyltransferase, TrmH family
VSPVINSPRNKRVTAAARLKKRAMREKDKAFLVEGSQGVLEALAWGSVREVFVSPARPDRLHQITDAASRAGVPVLHVGEDVMAHLTSTVTPQGVVAVASFVDVSLEDLPEAARFVPVLAEVRDPGNAGTILRSADAAGADGVVFTASSVDVYNPKTVRASAGSLFHVPVVRQADPAGVVAALRDRGWTILAASAEGERSVFEADLRRPVAVLFGNETQGLAPAVRDLADETVRVPIAGRAESLNLAGAASVVMFEWARQQDPTGGGRLAEIVAGAAHDVRSPLTAMRAFASTLSSRWDRLSDEERATMLGGVAHEAGRMELVLAQLVDAARLSSGTLSVSPSSVELLDAVRAEVERSAGWDPVAVEVSGEPAAAWVDPARLRTMVSAMVDAAQWWAEEGPVSIHVAPGPASTVSVARERPTIAPDQVERMFVPRTPGSGSGSKIGLFVARGLAEAHGGSLTAEAGGYLTLTLVLPVKLPPHDLSEPDALT